MRRDTMSCLFYLTLLLSRARDLCDAKRPSYEDYYYDDDSIPRHYSHLMTTAEEQW